MLSREEKLAYGQMLRKQMLQKQQQKRLQKRGGRAQPQPQSQTNNQPQSQNQNQQYRPTILQKQNNNGYQTRTIDHKQLLQQQFQNKQSYAFMNGMGRGNVSNGRVTEQNAVNRQEQAARNYSQPHGRVEQQPHQQSQQQPQYQQPQQRSHKNIQYQQQGYPNQNINGNNSFVADQQSISPQSPQQSYSQPQQPQLYNHSNSYKYIQPYLPQQNPHQQQYGRPVSYEQPRDYQPQMENRQNRGISEHDRYYQSPGHQQLSGSGYYQPQQQQHQQQYQQQYQQQPQQPQQPQQQPQQQYQQSQRQPQPQYQPTNNSNQAQLLQLHRNGARNLLKLQNQTVQSHLVKQKEKLSIQKSLKEQMEEAAERKRLEKERIKQQQEEQQRKNKAYIQQHNRKIKQEQDKKKRDQQKLIEDNLKNLQAKKKLQADAKKKAQDEEKRKLEHAQREKERLAAGSGVTSPISQSKHQAQEQNFQRSRNLQAQPPQNRSRPDSQSSSAQSSSSLASDTLQRGFDTGLSKEFFTKQRQKQKNYSNKDRKLQEFTSQIQQMKHQMQHQRDILQRQIQSVRDQAEQALMDKKKADQQISRLKAQLKRKLDQDNTILLNTLQKNGYGQDSETFRKPPAQYKQQRQNGGYNDDNNLDEDNIVQQDQPNFKKNKVPMKPKPTTNQLTKKQFQPMDYLPNSSTNQFMAENQSLSGSTAGLMSLDGDSKKIPLYLERQGNQNLTLSQVEGFAKDSAFFQKGNHAFGNQNKGGKRKSPPKYANNKNLNDYNESIQEVEQERDFDSRKSNRHKNKTQSQNRQPRDQLDNLMQSRAKSRGGWGEMSSVNSDITKEIEQLLKKKQNPYPQQQQKRPNSISNAGKQSLDRQAFSYQDAPLLSSNVGDIGGISNVGDTYGNGGAGGRVSNVSNGAYGGRVSNVGGTLGTNGTIDIDRINGRNDARLRELKNLGVQTINTHDDRDGDLNALDQLLNKYK